MTLMKKYYTNKFFLHVLITAFLFLQWSSTHIHLADKHEHNGSQHQHAVNAHQHQLSNHHNDVIDVAEDLSHNNSHKVVEIEQVCTHFNDHLNKQFLALPSHFYHSLKSHISAKRVITLNKVESYQAYYQYSSIRLRAPPRIS